MLRHVVMFRWTEATTADDVAAVEAALRQLPAAIPEIRAYTMGSDVGVNQGNYHYAVVADFDDEAAFIAYRDHPRHRAVIAERISDHLAERSAVQFVVDDRGAT